MAYNENRGQKILKKIIKIKVKPLSAFQVVFVWIILTIILIYFCGIAGIDTPIFLSLFTIIFFMLVLCFHMATVHLTKNLIITWKLTGKLEIHMKFGNLKKLIKPSLGAKAGLIECFSYEFIQAIEILVNEYPNKKYMTRTWLVPELAREYLQKSGFIIRKQWRRPVDIIAEFHMLRLGKVSIKKAFKSLYKHKNYKYVWSRKEAECFLSYLQIPEIRKKFRISA